MKNQEGPMDSGIALFYYTQLLQKWIKSEEQAVSYDTSIVYFHEKFLPQIEKNFKIKIVYDELVAELIIRIINSSPSYWKMIGEPLMPAKTARESISCIAKALHSCNFISKRRYKVIMSFMEGETDVEQRVNELYSALQQNMQEKEKMVVWGKIMGMGLRQFWKDIILSNEKVEVFKVKRIKILFDQYKGCLKANEKETYQKLKPFFIKKSKLSKELQRIFNQEYLFNHEKAQRIHKQVSRIKMLITEILTRNNLPVRSIEAYGSYRSRFCMMSSDVDLSIFISDDATQIREDRSYIQSTIHSIRRKLDRSLKEIQCEKIAFVINHTIKVPFITLHFDASQPLTEIDLVLNNRHGVMNSEMFECYSQNKTILIVGVLLKKWAKYHNFVGKEKLSCYGILLMLLYFLMATGRLRFPTKEQLIKNQINEKFLKDCDTFQILLEFFEFYAESGQFLSECHFLCIVENCKEYHEARIDYVYNMHDPFDNSNPGRYKMRSKYLLFDKIEETRNELLECKKNPTSLSNVFYF